MATKKARKDWMAELGEQLAAMLKDGVAPWEQPWVGGAPPTSLATGKPYQGINAAFLNAMAFFKGYDSNLWLTYNRARQLGGSVRKDEKGSPVMWAKWKPKNDPSTGEELEGQGYMAYGGSYVFNLSQTDGIDRDHEDFPDIEPATPPAKVTDIWFNMPDRPRVEIGGDMACYVHPPKNLVKMPAPDKFKVEGAFYHVLWHETAHWWTHIYMPDVVGKKRGIEAYSFGELVAEMTAGLMTQACGLPFDLEQDASYIKGWMKPIKDDPKLFTRAFAAAQKAAEWMLNVTPAPKVEQTVSLTSSEPVSGAVVA